MKKTEIFNRDIIKYIAVAAMTVNHIACIFLPRTGLQHYLLQDVGYITAIVMCFFLVEGFYYTRDLLKYALRLFCFAAVSQIPFHLALERGKPFLVPMNMIWSLFLCLLICMVYDKVQHPYLKPGLILGLAFVCYFSDWSWMAPLWTVLFLNARSKKHNPMYVFVIGGILTGYAQFDAARKWLTAGESLAAAAAAFLFVLIGGLLASYLYNGKKMEKGRIFHRWFFYLYYPLHLLLLYVIHMNRL